MEPIDAGRVGAWFGANVAGSVPPVAVEVLSGGRSNLNFLVTDSAGHEWVLRRPPPGAVLSPEAGAHDVAREYRILTALAPTPVPVALPVAFCDDASVAGECFAVTEHVAGLVLREPAEAEHALDDAGRRRAGDSFTDALADLHAVDPGAAGLDDLDGGKGHVAEQLRRWYGEAQAAQEVTGRCVLLIEEVYRHLSANVPSTATASPTVVHGDYRLDNAVVGDDGVVKAVLDWETASLGDPLAELGLLLAYWTNPGEGNDAFGGATATAVAGFPSRAEVAARYAERSGRDLSQLPFYVAFAYWKLACILEGVYARHLLGAAHDEHDAGPGRDDRSALAGFAAQVVRLAEAAREAAA